jgi:hypothetical protein
MTDQAAALRARLEALLDTLPAVDPDANLFAMSRLADQVEREEGAAAAELLYTLAIARSDAAMVEHLRGMTELQRIRELFTAWDMPAAATLVDLVARMAEASEEERARRGVLPAWHLEDSST